jgi:uncharacterized protein YcnI
VTRLARTLILAAGAALAAAPAAAAHIQVSPAEAAPGDAVKVTLLVPNEEGKPTTRIELKIPADVLPFSFEDTPGWTRKAVAAANGSIDRIVWTGSLPAESFVEFSFLAAMPEKAGDVSWKALQAYGDQIVRWIGPPGSEQPAAVTKVVEGAPVQNAGGENAEDGGSTETTPAETTTTAPAAETTSAAPASGSAGDDNDWPALIIAILGLVLGFVALLLVLTRRREAT